MAPTILAEYLIEYHSSALIKLDGRAQQCEQQLAQMCLSFYFFVLKLLLRNNKRSVHQNVCMESPRGQRGGESSAKSQEKQAVQVLKHVLKLEMFGWNRQMKNIIQSCFTSGCEGTQ